MRYWKTIYSRLLVLALIMMICLTGCKSGKTNLGVGDDKEKDEKNKITEVGNENSDEDDTEGSDDKKTTEAANNENTERNAYTLVGKSPVYDRSLTEGKMAMYFISSIGSFEYCGSRLYYGDSTLIIAPDGTTMLIDLQNPGLGSTVVATLDALGIDTIDYLVISHPHIDHLGGFKTVLRNKTVKQVYNNAATYTGMYGYQALYDELKEKQIPIKTLYEGDKFSFGGIEAEVFWPGAEDYEHSNTDRINQNNGSLAIKFTYGKSSFLACGDLHVESETAIIEKYGSRIQADVHKIDHHGNTTSSCNEWVKMVSPKIAIREGDPNGDEKVMGRFAINGSIVLATGMNGTIAVWTSGDGKYDVQVEVEQYHDYTKLPDNAKDGHFVVK